MDNQNLITTINNDMGIDLSPQLSFEAMRLQLQAVVNSMVNGKFEQLVNILYRLDVNERKLKYLLQENVGADAAVIIADLIIERQLEKIKFRQEYSRPDDSIPDDDKW
jgi:hypothetical protein